MVVAVRKEDAPTSQSIGFGLWLEKRREAMGLSGRQLAQKANVSSSHISRLQRGLLPPPTPRVLRRIAKVLGAPAEEAMEAAGYLKPDRNSPTPENLLASTIANLVVQLPEDRQHMYLKILKMEGEQATRQRQKTDLGFPTADDLLGCSAA